MPLQRNEIEKGRHGLSEQREREGGGAGRYDAIQRLSCECEGNFGTASIHLAVAGSDGAACVVLGCACFA